MFGVGIESNGRNDVSIEGPGVIQKFQRWGIFLFSSTHVTVKKVTANRNCWSGVQSGRTSNSNFEEDTFVNNAAGSNGAPCGGICFANSNNNLARKSKFYGNGSVDYPSGNVDFGIGFEGTSSGNRVTENDIAGNANGVLFLDSSSDNSVDHNIIAGNPAAQALKTFVASNQKGADIAFPSDFTGVNNMVEDNFCLTYIGPGMPPCPNILAKGKEDDEARVRLKGGEQTSSTKTAELRVQIVSALLLLATIARL
jgi:parallel beta-helix repeat protein